MKQIWNKLQKKLLEKHDNQFDIWLKPLEYITGTEDKIVVEAPNDIYREWVEDHYLNDMKAILHEITGKNISVQVTERKQSSSGDLQEKPRTAKTKQAASGREETSAPAPRLNPRFNFESFVVGSNNRLAHSAAVAVAQAPGKAYNPLFIYGGVGLGKTHLMQSIGHFVKAKDKTKKVVYITCEEFTNLLITAIQKGNTVDFRNKFRTIDILLIDDIQFLGKKESTQEEFFHTFNTLYDSHKQIVLSSDKPPKEISNVEERLVSRFEWGLAADLQPPDFETRVAILRKKAEITGIKISDEIINFIAETVKSNIRKLEGALIRVSSYSTLNEVPLDLSIAREAVQDLIKDEPSFRLNIDSIQETVATFYNINVQDLRGKKRPRFLVLPRQLSMYLCRKHTDYSLLEIGKYFGGKDHTTIIHACKKIEEGIKGDEKLRMNVSKIEEQLNVN
jgi:chromosomal replication initiator protein